MRVLFLTLSSFRSYPCYKRAVGTGEALALLGHDVYIVAQDVQENRERLSLEAPHCRALFFGRSGCLREVLWKLLTIWRVRPDVVYSTSYSLRNLAFLRVFLPWSSSVVIEFCELYSRYGNTQYWWKFVEWFAMMESTRLLCASRFLKEHFESLKSVFAVDVPVLYSPYAYPEYLRSECSKGLVSKKVVFMASLWRNYGVYDVVDACCKLYAQGYDFELEVLGGGPEKDKLCKIVAEKLLTARIHVRGFVPEKDLDRYFSTASVFVAPLHDTVQDRARCPSKVYYYIPYNKPIVTCALGDPLDVLGDFGFYYNPGNVDDMSRVLKSALDRCDSFSYPEGFIKMHSWRARAEQFLVWMKE